MKDILDYPEGTKGSDLPEDVMALHQVRGTKTVDAFGGHNAFMEYIGSKSGDEWCADYKAKFEEVNGVKFPNNIKFEL